MRPIVNPVLRGFEPDPSIVRWRDRYLIATSTFEWFPGVRLHASPDLAEWEVVGHALTSPDQLDLAGVPDSGGIWAPSLSVVGDELWLVYTVVRTTDGPSHDLDNYLTTTRDLAGPWSPPVRLGARGFDGSMFHDDDGRHWLACVQWDPRPGRESFSGIVVQEYDHAAQRLVGDACLVLRSPELIEGPNLYKVDGRYYLMVAQGGTGWNHGIAMARSDALGGPYETDPWFSLMTTRDAPESALQKAGHGELLRTPDGAWYLAHLASRPTWHRGERFCVIGRETCLQRVAWTDGWLRLADDDGRPLGTTVPRTEVSSTVAAEGPTIRRSPDLLDDFDGPLDSRRWSTLRRAADPSWLDLTARPGHLRLTGGQSPASRFAQSVVATRLRECSAVVTTVVEAEPTSPRTRAGLALHYDRLGYYYLHVTLDDDGRRVALVESSTPDGVAYLGDAHPVPRGPVLLRAVLDGSGVELAYSADGRVWTTVASGSSRVVSDDVPGLLRFTGAMAALRADDHDQVGFTADFDRAEVRYGV